MFYPHPILAVARRRGRLRGAPRVLLLMSLAAAVLAATAPSAVAQGFGDQAKEFFRVAVPKTTATVRPAPAFDVPVAFDVDEGIHVYAAKDKLYFEWDEVKGASFQGIVLPQPKAIPDILEEGKTVGVFEGKFEIRARFLVTASDGETIRIRGKVHYQGCTETTCYAPFSDPVGFTAKVSAGAAATAEAKGEVTRKAAPPAPQKAKTATRPAPDPPPATAETKDRDTKSEKTDEPDKTTATTETEEELPAEGGWLWNILWAFGWGVLISFTPCVYPIIPITVAILGGRREGSKTALVGSAIVYAMGLALTYAVVGLLVATLGNVVRSVLSSLWFLVPLAALFVLFALSMFDVFTLQVPQGLQEKLRKLTGTRSGAPTGFVGVFFLGVVAGIVAGPCVFGPVAAVLSYVAKTADRWLGFWMLFALGWGMSILLIVAGVSTGLLPKAGGWMAAVKHFLGFVMLWAAVYFLSPYLGTGIYNLLTALLIESAAFFLGLLDPLTAESGTAARLKRFAGIVAILGAAYLGLTGLGELRAAPAPGANTGAAATPAAARPFQYASAEEAQKAIGSGRLVVVKITGRQCAICKKLERDVLPDPRVVEAARPFITMKVMNDDYPKFSDLYHVVGPPKFLFFHDGKRIESREIKEMHKRIGKLTPERFAEILRSVQAEYGRPAS